jgi:hypothetical protein
MTILAVSRHAGDRRAILSRLEPGGTGIPHPSNIF